MNRSVTAWCTMLGLTATLLVGSSPVLAGQPDSVLYELTEIVTIDFDKALRIATSAIQGTARAGTPFCPDFLLEQLVAQRLVARAPKTCTLNALASNEISLVTFSGPFKGTLVVVVEAPMQNDVDSPELEVLRGTVEGTMGVADPEGRLLRMTGTFTVPGLPPAALTGTFRLPFRLDAHGRSRKPHRHEAAFYLSDTGHPFAARPDETALGYATVRVEVNFD